MLGKLILNYYQVLRIKIFRFLSSRSIKVEGTPRVKQPLELEGNGIITFGSNVQLGYFPSPFFYDGSIYLEVRSSSAKIEFGDNIFCNNNLKIICDKSFIKIGSCVLIGTNVEIYDSDFHEVNPFTRNSGNHKCMPVIINDNVFVGSNVRIFKGVEIGENAVIANSAIVTKSFPANVVIGGNPAKIISNISFDEN